MYTDTSPPAPEMTQNIPKGKLEEGNTVTQVSPKKCSFTTRGYRKKASQLCFQTLSLSKNQMSKPSVGVDMWRAEADHFPTSIGLVKSLKVSATMLYVHMCTLGMGICVCMRTYTHVRRDCSVS